jgi:GGDEF domain-containing protein
MARMRKASAVVLVLAMTALAMLAWWTMLAAERGAVRASEDGARKAAVAAAVAISTQQRTGGDVASVVAMVEQAGDLRLVVTDAAGRAVAGDAPAGAATRSVAVPGTSLTVAAVVDSGTGVGLGRFSHLVTAFAFLVMAGSVTSLVIVARQRRHAEAEIRRLGRRWEETAASDDLTGLGNRTRLLEDAAALSARGIRYGNSFGLALFEVAGEPADDVVRALSELISGEARGADLCYRIGEGRFVTLLPEQDETGAALAAERVRRAIADRLGEDAHTGVASFSPWLPCTAADLLVRAELDLGAAALMGGGGADRYAARQVHVATHAATHVEA